MAARYRIRASNFGPIRDAEVELRPLTVFVGPSNTGKSYLAGLLYALHRAMQPTQFGLGSRIVVPRRLWPSPVISKELEQTIVTWLANTETSQPEPGMLEPLIHDVLNQSLGLGRALTAEVARCFGVEDPRTLVRHGSDAQAASLELLVPQAARKVAHLRAELRADAAPPAVDGAAMRLGLPSHLRKRLHEEAHLIHGDRSEARDLAVDRLISSLTETAFRNAFRPVVINGAYYLPADRTGVMHSHHVVVSTLLQRASLAGIRRFDDVPMLSGVMADFLGRLGFAH